MAITNSEIIFNNQLELMNAGIISGTGRKIKVTTTNPDGTKTECMIDEPEPIHTYATWKAAGYQVKRGEKAIASFTIWKHINKKPAPDEEPQQSLIDNGFCIMKQASFFKFSQVEPAKA